MLVERSVVSSRYIESVGDRTERECFDGGTRHHIFSLKNKVMMLRVLMRNSLHAVSYLLLWIVFAESAVCGKERKLGAFIFLCAPFLCDLVIFMPQPHRYIVPMRKSCSWSGGIFGLEQSRKSSMDVFRGESSPQWSLHCWLLRRCRIGWDWVGLLEMILLFWVFLDFMYGWLETMVMNWDSFWKLKDNTLNVILYF